MLKPRTGLGALSNAAPCLSVERKKVSPLKAGPASRRPGPCRRQVSSKAARPPGACGPPCARHLPLVRPGLGRGMPGGPLPWPGEAAAVSAWRDRMSPFDSRGPGKAAGTGEHTGWRPPHPGWHQPQLSLGARQDGSNCCA